MVSKHVNASICALLVASGLTRAGDGVNLDVIARTGQPAPGMGAEVTFVEFDALRINAGGLMTFWATTAGGGVSTSNREGIWRVAGSGPELVLRQGSDAPWYSDPAQIVAMPQPTLAADGSMAFNGSVSALGIPPAPYNDADNSGVFRIMPTGEVIALARKGDPTSGLPDGTFFRNQLQVQQGADGPAAFATNAGLSIVSDRSGVPEEVYGQGIQAPGLSRTFTLLENPTIDAVGGVTFRAALSGSPLPIQQFVLVSDVGGAPQSLLVSGDPAPGVPGATIDEIGSRPVSNNAGQIVVHATLDGVSETEDSGIWAFGPGATGLIVAESMDAPGLPGIVFDRFMAPVNLSDGGLTAFWAGLREAGQSAGSSVWACQVGSAPVLVSRSGMQVFDQPADVAFGAIEQPVVDGQGQIYFMTRLAGASVTTTSNRALMVRDIVGRVQTVIRTGDSIEVAPGDVRVVDRIVFETTSPQSGHGQINGARELVFHVRFSDRTFAALRGYVRNPADLVDDGFLDIGDLFAFLDAFVTQQPLHGDFNQDGEFDIDDFFLFLDAFSLH